MSVEPHRHGQRRGTAAEWTAANPVLAAGELGIETDTSLMKIGDGVTVWADLAYANRGPQGPQGGPGPTGAGVPDTSTASAGDAVVFDGTEIVWGLPSGPAPTVQDFTASGTWTKPAGARWVRVECIGAGGSGLKTGGGGGERKEAWFLASDLTATVAVTVGAGGAGGTTAHAGGSSTFGTYLRALGGSGAVSATVGGPGGGYGGPDGGGDGGSAGNGQDSGNAGGGGGLGSTGGVTTGGAGGASGDASALLGGDGGNGQSTAAGGAGTAPGGGGGGGRASGADFGGAGARGQVRVTTYF